eukprot:468966_1
MDLSDKMNIFIAIETGDFKMLQTVQEYHIRNVFSTKKGSINGLHYCCQYERPKMLKFLLENNMKLVTKINDQNFLGNTAAFIAIITMSEYKNKWSDYSFNCLKILCEWKRKYVVNLNIPNLKGQTILMHTALHNQIEVMKYLLSLKNKDNVLRIDMEIQDKQKQTAIMYAIKHSNFESVMILYGYGARCDVKTLKGTNSSDYASGKIKMFVDIQYCMDGLKMVRDIKMKQGIHIPMELIYIVVYYVCDMGDMEKLNEIKEKMKKKLEKQNSKGDGKKQKRKQVMRTGPSTLGD